MTNKVAKKRKKKKKKIAAAEYTCISRVINTTVAIKPGICVCDPGTPYKQSCWSLHSFQEHLKHQVVVENFHYENVELTIYFNEKW